MSGRKKKTAVGATHVPRADGRNPAFYYTVCDVDSPRALACRERRMSEFEFWLACLPGPAESIEAYSTRMAADTGLSRWTIKQSFVPDLCFLAESMPRLVALQRLLGHLDLTTLRAIASEVSAVADADTVAELDRRIAEYLTPTAPRQALPARTTIKDKVRQLVNVLDPEIHLSDEAPEVPEGRFDLSEAGPGAAQVWVTLPPEDAAWLDAAVGARARADGSTKAAAFLKLVEARVDTKVVLNLYKAADLLDAPVWVPSAGWLSAAGQARWEQKVTRVRDLAEGRVGESAAHDAPEGLRTWLRGVHETCCGPGCTTPGTGSQIEHRLPHESGGATALDNLSLLSQHWHNLKTTGQAAYLTDPQTGATVWVLPDGSWQVTVAEGPLSPKGARLAASVSAFREEKRRRARQAGAAARERWRMREIDAGRGDPDNPPF